MAGTRAVGGSPVQGEACGPGGRGTHGLAPPARGRPPRVLAAPRPKPFPLPRLLGPRLDPLEPWSIPSRDPEPLPAGLVWLLTPEHSRPQSPSPPRPLGGSAPPPSPRPVHPTPSLPPGLCPCPVCPLSPRSPVPAGAGLAGEEALEEEEEEAEPEPGPENPEDSEKAAPGCGPGSGAGGTGGGGRGCVLTRRGITLRVLLKDALIEPGSGVLSIYYLGKKFIGDLLPDGKITWQETGQVFNSPSAWATYCKKLVNPAKKSGCGWASVKYKGQKLDQYKATWLKRHQPNAPSAAEESLVSEGEEEELLEEEEEETAVAREGKMLTPASTSTPVFLEEKGRKQLGKVLTESPNPEAGPPGKRPENKGRVPVRYCTLGSRDLARNPHTLVEVTSFTAINKFQPFNVSVSSNVLLLLDFHSHLTRSEVVGYLGGRWDTNSQLLTVLRAFPCRSRLGDADTAAAIEEEICQSLFLRGLSLVGWYHSHPYSPALPSLQDIDAQMDYQLKLQGSSNSFQPCLALVCAPYYSGNQGPESKISPFWVMPPPEQRPNDYGIPMEVEMTYVQDGFLTNDILHEMMLLVDFYKGAPDVVKFQDLWNQEQTYLDKLKVSLASRTPKDQGLCHVLEQVYCLLKNSS